MTPFVELTILSLALSFIVVIISRLLTNPEEIRKIKGELEFYKAKLKKAQKSGDKGKVNQLTNDMLKTSQRQLKCSMKPLIVTMIVFIIAFSWLGAQYADLSVNLPFSFPFVGSQLNWLWWYILIIFSTTTLFRKSLGVE